ncbi:unnamed protein product, partial [Polarella glacialis]
MLNRRLLQLLGLAVAAASAASPQASCSDYAGAASASSALLQLSTQQQQQQELLTVSQVQDTSKDQQGPGYEHPAWLQACKTIYLDVGSNIGVMVRKLYEPESYPEATALPLFSSRFGSPNLRGLPSNVSGICALGFEPNPHRTSHLAELASNYSSKGWHVHFYPFAAWSGEGTMQFNVQNKPERADWGAKLVDKSTELSSTVEDLVSVRSIDLAAFVKSLPAQSVGLMKMDIEGAEYETLAHMLEKDVLCSDFIPEMFMDSA